MIVVKKLPYMLLAYASGISLILGCGSSPKYSTNQATDSRANDYQSLPLHDVFSKYCHEPKDEDKCRWAANKGHAGAMVNMGWHLKNKGQLSDAKAYFLKGYKTGTDYGYAGALSANGLAHIAFNDENDTVNGCKWMLRAIDLKKYDWNGKLLGLYGDFKAGRLSAQQTETCNAIEEEPAKQKKAAAEILTAAGPVILACIHPTGSYGSTSLSDVSSNGGNITIKGDINWRGGFTGKQYYSSIQLTIDDAMNAKMELVSENSPIRGGKTCGLGGRWVPLSEYGSYSERSGATLLLGVGAAAAAGKALGQAMASSSSSSGSSAGGSGNSSSSGNATGKKGATYTGRGEWSVWSGCIAAINCKKRDITIKCSDGSSDTVRQYADNGNNYFQADRGRWLNPPSRAEFIDAATDACGYH